MTIPAGTKLGRYEIRSKIGEGGMGEVYLAEDTKLDRKVALKILPADVAANRNRMTRFIQEAKSASALNHPNIITIYEIEQVDSTHFIATEFIDGVTLRARMDAGSLLPAEVLEVAIQVASALDAAHAAGIVHRDIKPENIMLRRDEIVKLLDFGLAKLTPEAESGSEDLTLGLVKTQPGAVMGTVTYMSPDQARGLPVDARTDIWSLGVVLYEALAGGAPFQGETLSDTLAAILKTEPLPLKQVAAGVPDELDRIVGKALRHDKEDRYQTAKELLLDLRYLKKRLESGTQPERTLTGQPGAGSANLSTRASVITDRTAAINAQPSIPARINHNRVALIVISGLVIVGLAALIYMVWLRDSPAQRSPSQYILSRLTFDPGLQSEPSWSPDGNFIAYSSDRSGNFDIWVKPLGEGNAVQVTKSPAQDWQPDWSSDGKRIVFRSERDGGGLFVVPAPTGGNERKISAFGHRPVWSPDGSQVLFYSANLQNTPAPPKLYLVALDGGQPREVLTTALSNMTGRLRAAWHPDGKHISLWTEQRGGGLAFFTVPLPDGSPVKSEISPDIDRQLKASGVSLFDFRWAPSGQALYFEGISRGIHNLWKVAIDPQTLRWTAGPDRLTTGAGPDGNLSVSPDGSKLAFTTRTEHTRLWSLPFNAATGQVRNEGQPATPAGIDAFSFDLSRDGKKLAYVTERAGRRELWEKSLSDGSEKSLAAAEGFSRAAPRWSRDGLRLAYVRSRLLNEEGPEYEHTLEHAIMLVDVTSSNEQALTSQHYQQGWSWDWTADQQSILGSSSRGTPGQWGLYLYPLSAAPNAESQARLIASRPGYSAFNARYSPDEKWICFIGIKNDDAGDGAIFVIPAGGGEWTRITEGSDYNDKPRWSPDGRMIYFISNRTGFFNVWGQRFDPASGQLTGEAVRVTNFESPGRMIPPGIVPIEISLAANRLIVPIMEVSGSIWILENVNR